MIVFELTRSLQPVVWGDGWHDGLLVVFGDLGVEE
jgi:hypothetical protein